MKEGIVIVKEGFYAAVVFFMDFFFSILFILSLAILRKAR